MARSSTRNLLVKLNFSYLNETEMTHLSTPTGSREFRGPLKRSTEYHSVDSVEFIHRITRCFTTKTEVSTLKLF